MAPETQDGRPAWNWTVTETHTLLDLIRDTGFISALARKGFQNWDVFERLCVLLQRCSIRVSSVDVKTHWQALKVKFWSLKRLADMSLVRVSGITADFPFYEEMAQLLTPQSDGGSCKREADSSGQESPVLPSSSSLDSGLGSEHEDQTASSSHQEAEEQQEQDVADPGPDIQREAPGGALQVGPGEIASLCTQRLTVLLHNVTQQILALMDRLVGSLDRLSVLEEQLSIQLGYMCSIALQMNSRLHNVSSEQHRSQETAGTTEPPSSSTGWRRSRVMRRGLRRSARYHP
ncbi:uncharacterized protein LOC142110369 isoform X2 [Mixophyes fleayi]